MFTIMKSKNIDKETDSHTHKKRKHTKHKRKKEASSNSSSSGSESEKMEWVEASEVSAAVKVTHDAWMESDVFVRTLDKKEMCAGVSRRDAKQQEREEKKQREEMIYKQRELNPNLREQSSAPPTPAIPSTSVGDGGYLYLRKALLRIRERAQAEGLSMEEVAKERWGSLSKLESMIEEARLRMDANSKNKYGSSRMGDHKAFQKNFKKQTRSPSPDNSIRFERPRNYQKNRSKVNFSSSRDHRRQHHQSNRSFPDDHEFSYASDDRGSNEVVRNTRDVRYSTKDQHYSNTTSSTDGEDDEKYGQQTNTRREDECSRGGNYRKDEQSSKYSRHEEQYSKSSRINEGYRKNKKDFNLDKVHVPAWKKTKSVDKAEIEEPEVKTTDVPDERVCVEPASKQCEAIRNEDDLNRLAAKYLKAELMGRTTLAQELKAQLEEARKNFYNKDSDSAHSGTTSGYQGQKKQQVVLTKVDSSGQQRPIVSSREEAGFERQHKKNSRKYVDDSSRYTLKQMFHREKLTTAEDNLEMFMDVAAECRESDGDEETTSISQKASHKMSHSTQEQRDINKAIQQHQKTNAALENCPFCLDQPKMQKHLIVTIGQQFYVSLPNYQSLTKGHCLVVPRHHVTSFLALDDDARLELQELEHQLRRFFAASGESVVFLETSMNLKHCPHAYRECIPMPPDTADMAPLYFKKALLESEEEWAHNVKLVDLTKKGLYRSIPKNFPYFCVLFDPAVHAGYAHVIEDERIFPRNFGKEVLGGMMDVDYDRLYKNRRELDPLQKSTETLEFTKRWDKFKSRETKQGDSDSDK